MSEMDAGGAEAVEGAEEVPAGDRPFPWGDESETPEAPQPGDPGYATRADDLTPRDDDNPDPQYAEGEEDPNAEPAEEGGEDTPETPTFEWEGDGGLRVALDENGTPMVFGVKADGQTYDVPIDELARGYARTAATTRKFQELANKRKHAEGIINIFQETAKTGDYHRMSSVLKQVGVDAQSLFDGWAEQQYREMQMSETERYELRIQRMEQEQQRERERWEAEAREKQLEAEAQSTQARLEQAIPQALERVGLGKDPQAYDAVIGAMLEASQVGYAMSPQEAAALVAEQRQKSVAQRIPDDPEELEKILGPDRIAALRKRAVERVRQAPPPKRAASPTRRSREPDWVPMPDNPDDLRAFFDS